MTRLLSCQHTTALINNWSHLWSSGQFTSHFFWLADLSKTKYEIWILQAKRSGILFQVSCWNCGCTNFIFQSGRYDAVKMRFAWEDPYSWDQNQYIIKTSTLSDYDTFLLRSCTEKILLKILEISSNIKLVAPAQYTGRFREFLWL